MKALRTPGLLAIAVTLTGVMALPPAASAPSCRLGHDAAGDAEVVLLDALPPQSTDLIAGFASRQATVLRLQTTTADLGAWRKESPGGVSFNLEFVAGRGAFLASASRSPIEDRFQLYVRSAQIGDENNGSAAFRNIGFVDGDFDEDSSVLTIDVPLRSLGLTDRSKASIRVNRTFSFHYVDGIQTAHSSDSMAGSHELRLPGHSCHALPKKPAAPADA